MQSLQVSRIALVSAMVLCLITAAAAQKNAAKTVAPAVDDAFVQKEFGSTCRLNKDVAPVITDLNGDGVKDIVIAAHCANPMIDAVEHRFTVIDPYMAFYGFGNPQITTQYSTEDPHYRDLALLIIHGDGPEAWRSATPKAKYLVVNLAYKDIAARHYLLKKKRIEAVYIDEADQLQTVSVLFWDGKKYRYNPVGASMDQADSF
jgi:hypothetical protein